MCQLPTCAVVIAKRADNPKPRYRIYVIFAQEQIQDLGFTDRQTSSQHFQNTKLITRVYYPKMVLFWFSKPIIRVHEILRLPITQSVGCGSGITKYCFKTIFTTTATQEMSSFCQIAIAVCTTVVCSYSYIVKVRVSVLKTSSQSYEIRI